MGQRGRASLPRCRSDSILSPFPRVLWPREDADWPLSDANLQTAAPLLLQLIKHHVITVL